VGISTNSRPLLSRERLRIHCRGCWVALGAVLFAVEYGYRRNFPKVKGSGLEVAHPPLCYAKFKNEWRLCLYAYVMWTGTNFNLAFYLQIKVCSPVTNFRSLRPIFNRHEGFRLHVYCAFFSFCVTEIPGRSALT
jgi:hypothetical protein